MKRILGAILGLASALALSSAAPAAPVSFDVSGTGSATFHTVVPSAPAPPCGNGETAAEIVCAFSPGSTLELDVSAGSAAIASSTLYLHSRTALPGGATIETDQTLSLSGGYGTLAGDDVVWSSPASYSASGTFRCEGSDCSSFFGLTEGTDYPMALLRAFDGSVLLSEVDLGTWSLDASHTSILGSTRAVATIADGSRAGFGLQMGSPMSWLVFGPADLGPVPEPGSAMLALLGLALLLRR